MITRYIISFFVCFAVLTACIEVQDRTELAQKPYFDLPAFAQKQIDLLDSLSTNVANKPVVTKKVIIGENIEEVELSGNDVDYPVWEKELQLFKEADINKPVLLNSYEAMEKDDVKIYKALEVELNIQELKVTYEGDKVKEIYLKLNEENYLYTSYKDLVMKVENGLINEIDIKGYRKLVGNDSLKYQVNTHLSFPGIVGLL